MDYRLGVAWNSVADTFIVQRPPGSQNWSIGGRDAIHDQPRPGGSVNEPRGAFDSHTAENAVETERISPSNS